MYHVKLPVVIVYHVKLPVVIVYPVKLSVGIVYHVKLLVRIVYYLQSIVGMSKVPVLSSHQRQLSLHLNQVIYGESGG